MTDAELRDAASAARDLGLTIELGTKGIEPAHLRAVPAARRGLRRPARAQHALRSRLAPDARRGRGARCAPRCPRTRRPTSPSRSRPTSRSPPPTSSASSTRSAARSWASASTPATSSPASSARATPSSSPRRCVANVHVKDFAFARQDGWVGFTYSGAPMGTGLHDYPHLLETVRPRERGINEIVEHWLPWQGDAETTIRTERDWTRTTLEYLRSTLMSTRPRPTRSPSSAPAARWACACRTTSPRPPTPSPTSRTPPPARSARSTRVAS